MKLGACQSYHQEKKTTTQLPLNSHNIKPEQQLSNSKKASISWLLVIWTHEERRGALNSRNQHAQSIWTLSCQVLPTIPSSSSAQLAIVLCSFIISKHHHNASQAYSWSIERSRYWCDILWCFVATFWTSLELSLHKATSAMDCTHIRPGMRWQTRLGRQCRNLHIAMRPPKHLHSHH